MMHIWNLTSLILLLITVPVITTGHLLCFHYHHRSYLEQQQQQLLKNRQTPQQRHPSRPPRRGRIVAGGDPNSCSTRTLFNSLRHGAIITRSRTNNNNNNNRAALTCLGGESNVSSSSFDRENKQEDPSSLIPPPPPPPAPPAGRGGTILVVGWVVAMSTFILKNYASVELWPTPLLAEIPIPYLGLMHNLSNMIFSGSIITTTVIEWIVTDSNDFKIIPFWFDRIQKVERFLVLPALFLSIVSGIIRSNVTYGTSLMNSPLHIKSSLHLLATFGMWWGITDRTTINRVPSLLVGVLVKEHEQGKSSCSNPSSSTPHDDSNHSSSERSSTATTTSSSKVVTIRRISNIISCAFLVASYAIMTLKPGLTQ